jgi:hypothetical protein
MTQKATRTPIKRPGTTDEMSLACSTNDGEEFVQGAGGNVKKKYTIRNA